MIQRDTITVTPSSGDGQENSRRLHGLLRLISCVPTTTGSAYDLKLTDDQSLIVFHRKGIVGIFRDTTPIPVRSILTVDIENADNDDAHTVSLCAEDHY